MCSRCGTYRRDVVDRFHGNLLYRVYRHPDGYSLPKGEAPKLDEVRVQYLKNVKRKERKAQ